MSISILNILAFSICIFFILLNMKIKKKFFSIVQIQNLSWCIGLYIYQFGKIKYNVIDDRVYFMAIAYLLFFNIFSLVNCKFNMKASPNKSIIISLKDKKKNNRCLFGSIVCWILSISILQKTIPILLAKGLGEGMNVLRYTIYGSTSFLSTFEMMLIDFVIRPVFLVTIIFMSMQIAYKIFNIKIIIVSIINALMLVLLTAGRTMMVSLVFFVVFAVLSVNGMNLLKLIRRYYKQAIIACFILFIFIQVSSNRVNRGEGILYEIELYYFSGLPYFSTLLGDGVKAFSLLGTGLFGSFVDLFVLVYRFFGFNISGASQFISNITQISRPIGQGLATNATASILLPLYLDFGFLGGAIGGSILGFASNYIETKAKFKPNCLNFALYLYFFVGMATSIQNYAFVGVGTASTIIFIIMFFSDKKIIGVKFK